MRVDFSLMADEEDFVGIWQPLDGSELALIHCALSGTGINYYVNNEHAVQAGGPGIGVGASRMTLRVERGRADEALALVKAILGGKPAP